MATHIWQMMLWFWCFFSTTFVLKCFSVIGILASMQILFLRPSRNRRSVLQSCLRTSLSSVGLVDLRHLSLVASGDVGIILGRFHQAVTSKISRESSLQAVRTQTKPRCSNSWSWTDVTWTGVVQQKWGPRLRFNVLAGHIMPYIYLHAGRQKSSHI